MNNCNNNACKGYGQYVDWLDNIPHEEKAEANIIERLEFIAQTNNVQVHNLLEHKQCHQFVDHSKVQKNQAWRKVD